MRFYRAILASGATALALTSCTSTGYGDPITAGDTVTAQPVTPQARQQGQAAYGEIVKEFGGLYAEGNEAGYVTAVGRKIAVQSGLANSESAYTVSLLNSPVNNAFATPGGYVYITRQLVALANDEAEMAGVLGHEVGHVAANHAGDRKSAQTKAGLAGVLGQVLGGFLGNNGGILGSLGGAIQKYAPAAAQFYTLSYSRGQEEEADDLGVRYLSQAGYDPVALSDMLASLAAQTAIDQRAAGQDARSVPEWASTHPDPARRVVRSRQVAQTYAPGGIRNRDQHLAAIDGILYGDDPHQGVIEGRTFLHPDLGLRFSVPQGYGMSNSANAVSIQGQNGQAQFATASFNGDLQSYIATALRSVAGDTQLQAGQLQRTTVNGIPAAYQTARAATQNGQVDVTVFAYQFSGTQAYHFVTLTPAGSNPFGPMFQSLSRLSAADAAQIKPRRIDVVTAQSGDTATSLARRMAYDNLQTERFMALNGLAGNAGLQAGQRYKIVTY
ncbi:M48 family metalloprotease [Novosphingopyxis sp.]|uniref:M48 family metalloprotease n=1 Tax=Novosphingopyxis sp. TaxID=2709690 RepID=UPI003B58ED02